MPTLQITYTVDDLPNVVVYNLVDVSRWSITVLPRQGRRPLQYKIEVFLMPRRIRDSEGGLVDSVEHLEYIFQTFEDAKDAIIISSGDTLNIKENIPPKLDIVPPEAPLPPVPAMEATINKWLSAHSEPIPDVIQRLIVPNKVESYVSIKEEKVKTSIDIDAKDTLVADLNFSGWAKDCMGQKNLIRLSDLITKTQAELTISLGRKASQDIVSVLYTMGIKLNP